MAHFLKRLELNGFKSFAGKTVLEFPAGITAIVGPNGSGKSNVVDAIRWLLGERDAKSLRGARIDDLIFAGTAKRPRMGQASASLHFDNKNNFFPVDFAEVSVVRQISRDGNSKYFLNQAEILLRDLVDFLAKARLGSRGMIVVTQGNSDMFIRATPRERREMIEEILGLREYQLKKADAERRLKHSQINLDKTAALIEEILPHLRSLKRQTARWEKRGEFEDELLALEKRFFGSQFRDIAEKLAVIQKKIEAGKGERTALERDKKAAEEAQAKVESSQPEGRKDIQKIKDETYALLEKRSELTKELGRIEAQIEMSAEAASPEAAATVEKLLHFVKEIKEMLAEGLHGEAVELEDAVRRVIEEIDAMVDDDRHVSAETVRTATAGSASPAIKAQFEKVNRDLRALEKQLNDLKEKESTLEKNQEAFYHAFKAAVAAVEAAKDRIEQWELRNREGMYEKERLALREEELVRQAGQAGRDPRDLRNAQADALGAEELAAAEKRIFRLRGDLASLGEIDEALVKEARETESRYEFLSRESEDLTKAVADLRMLIKDVTEKIKNEFDGALTQINDEFGKFFEVMFGGGHAKLRVEKPEAKIKEPGEDGLTEPETEAEDEDEEEEAIEQAAGVEIEVRLPRKKINSLEMLSGGERSLVGIAALFAMVSVSPPPFLVLDEIDAPLDERNARRFGEMLKEFSKKTQFIVVTHNRATMEA
ncbi:MAG TPA: AAA family ATPase, partial [Candidatus Paceibacterota bacterium]|nr:AAA family ATPase [Candidatus Paceibacterota bacterium]